MTMGASKIDITTYDGATADESIIRAAYTLSESEDVELRAEDPPIPFEEFAAFQRSALESERRVYWLARAGDGTPVGRAELRFPTQHNLHLGNVLVYVHPDHRRQGIGTRLAQAVVAEAAADGRTDLVTDINDGHPGEAFFTRLGGKVGLPQRISRLDLHGLDRDLMARWISDGEATDYSLVSWRARCPDEWLDGYAHVITAMNGAPVDGLPIEDRVHTPASIRERENELREAHLERWTIAAVHDRSHELAGFTDVVLVESSPENAWQGGTGVLPEHRGHGLGRWMKAAMAAALREERPALRWIDTENAYSNGPMLAINVAMGFEVIRTVNGWSGTVAAARAALGL